MRLKQQVGCGRLRYRHKAQWGHSDLATCLNWPNSPKNEGTISLSVLWCLVHIIEGLNAAHLNNYKKRYSCRAGKARTTQRARHRDDMA